MTSKKSAFAVLVATCIGTSQLASQAAPATTAQNAAPSIAKLQVELDTTGIAKSTKVEILPKDPYASDDVISLSGAPMHVRILFDGKKLQYGDNDFRQPHLLIYKLADYAAVFPKDKQTEFNKQIATIRKIIANKSSKGFDEIPVLPQSDGAQFCHLQEKFLTFNNNKGTGVSFVTAYGNGDPPLNEADFTYAFQGITADSKYYVAFYWPVKATGLPKDLPLPKSNQYCQKLARAKYDPSLDSLDRAVSSITLK